MQINNLNQRINWQQLTAKEILEYQQEGAEVPSEYQKWAAAISASMNVQDEVTYEMVNGETDIAALEAVLGREEMPPEMVQEPEGAEMGNETPDEEPTPTVALEEGADEPPATRTQTELPENDVTLADEAITTDFNEIIKRRQRRGLS